MRQGLNVISSPKTLSNKASNPLLVLLAYKVTQTICGLTNKQVRKTICAWMV